MGASRSNPAIKTVMVIMVVIVSCLALRLIFPGSGSSGKRGSSAVLHCPECQEIGMDVNFRTYAG